MTILRAQHLGMCFGVRDAIALAQHQALQGPLTILGELVHNQYVLTDLKRRGVQIADRAEHAEASRAMITAHGTSLKNRKRTLARLDSNFSTPLVRWFVRPIPRSTG